MRSLLSWKYGPNVFSLVVIALLLAVYFAPFGDLDFGILIRLGEEIAATGQLMPPEHFTYTIAGTQTPTFEWLCEVVLWAIWTAFGYGGLKLLKVLLVGTTLLLVGLRLRFEGVRWHGIALALILAVVVLASNWNLRPYYFTTIGLLLVSWWLHDHCTGRRPLTWWLPVVLLVWGNVHPGVITGQALLLGAIGWEWLNHWLKLNPPLDLRGCRRLTLIGGLGIAATFIHPAPVARLLAPFAPQVRHPIMRLFDEMQPLHQAALKPPYVEALVYVLFAVVLLTVVLRFRQYRLWEIMLLTGVAGLACTAVRSVQDAVLVMLSVSVPQLARLLGEWARQDRRRWWVRAVLKVDTTCKRLLLSPPFRCQWLWPTLAFAVLAVVSLLPLGRDMPLQDRPQDPTAAVQQLQTLASASDHPSRIFAPPDYASYLVWKLGSQVRCYVDTRGFCFPPELMEDGHYVPALGPNWRSRLNRVLAEGTEYFFLETQGPRGQLWQALRQPLQELGEQPLILDQQAVLLTAEQVRRGVAQMDLARAEVTSVR